MDADRERLVQVLSNLLGDAATHTPMGGRIAVAVKTTPDGILEIRVKPVPPDALQRLLAAVGATAMRDDDGTPSGAPPAQRFGRA